MLQQQLVLRNEGACASVEDCAAKNCVRNKHTLISDYTLVPGAQAAARSLTLRNLGELGDYKSQYHNREMEETHLTMKCISREHSLDKLHFTYELYQAMMNNRSNNIQYIPWTDGECSNRVTLILNYRIHTHTHTHNYIYTHTFIIQKRINSSTSNLK